MGEQAWQEGQRAWRRLGRPSDAINALGEVRTIRLLLEEKERELVTRARKEETPWSAIGAALGVSRQAAWERWHEVDSTVKGA